jgi:Kef-type K+ transport system membrane component KefB
MAGPKPLSPGAEDVTDRARDYPLETREHRHARSPRVTRRRATLIPTLVAGSLIGFPALADAASTGGHGGAAGILFGLAILVLLAKVGGLVVQRLGQPSVLGELVLGVILGNFLPPFLGASGIAAVRSDPTLMVLAQMGVLILLFDVGLEVDLRAMVGVGGPAFSVALLGIAAPFLLGWGAAAWLMPGHPVLAQIFVGATLSATSVGITARVLRDLGATRSREAQIILGAAVIDDILGLVVLAVVSSAATVAGSGGSELSVLAVGGILLKAVVFLGITVGFGHRLSGPIVRLAGRTGERGALLVIGLALCFSLSYLAELIGLADIIGAFAAGVMLDPFGEGIRTRQEEATLHDLMDPISTVFVPLFFVLMGIQVNLGSLTGTGTLLLGGTLIVCALAGKLVAGLGAWGGGVNRLAVGIGMIPRGEVGLIFAGIGTSLTLQGQPLLSEGVFSAIVLMVLVTTLLTPPGLRWAFRRRPPA